MVVIDLLLSIYSGSHLDPIHKKVMEPQMHADARG
ncbi:hypothetical protein NUACC26_087700 [Scytonema sp. NUACC26]